MQDLPVVPGQCVPRDEDVLRHHRLRGGKEPALGLSFRHRQNQERRKEPLSLPRGPCSRPEASFWSCVRSSLCFHSPNLSTPLREVLRLSLIKQKHAVRLRLQGHTANTTVPQAWVPEFLPSSLHTSPPQGLLPATHTHSFLERSAVKYNLEFAVF